MELVLYKGLVLSVLVTLIAVPSVALPELVLARQLILHPKARCSLGIERVGTNIDVKITVSRKDICPIRFSI